MLICISGPSGCGKSTIAAIFELKGFFRVKTSTTRNQRLNDPVDSYNFVDDIDEDNYCCITEVNGELYGIDKDYVREMNPQLNYIVVLDELGVDEISKLYKGNTYKFYVNVLEKTCLERMKERGDAPQNIALRLQEDREHNRYNYLLKDNDLYDYCIYGENDPYLSVRQIMDYIEDETSDSVDEGEEILRMLQDRRNHGGV